MYVKLSSFSNYKLIDLNVLQTSTSAIQVLCHRTTLICPIIAILMPVVPTRTVHSIVPVTRDMLEMASSAKVNLFFNITYIDGN